MTKKLEYVEPKSYFTPEALKVAREYEANKARQEKEAKKKEKQAKSK